MIGDPELHRRRHPQRFVDAAKIVVGDVQGDRRDVVLKLLAVLYSRPRTFYSKVAMLSFRCYLASDGRDVIREWYLDQAAAIRADFAGIIIALEGNRRARLNADIFKPLEKHSSSKSCVGFHEILVDRDHVHHRIIGYLHDDVFTMLVAFPKSEGNKYKIPCDVAVSRRNKIANDHGRSKNWEFPANN